MSHRRVRALVCARIRAAGLLVALAGLAACGEAPVVPAAPEPDDAYARATHFTFEGGLGGGRRAGRTIHRDGLFEVWKSDPAVQQGARVAPPSARLSPAAVREVFAAARGARFLDVRLLEDDDFGMSMEMLGPDGPHRVAWSRAGDAPQDLRPIADVIARLKGAGP